MNGFSDESRTVRHKWVVFSFAALTLIAGISPHVGRLGHPSIYTDDVVRLAQLQTVPLHKLLFLPFNEHTAPGFQAVSWITWKLAGGRLVRAPVALTLASFVPFLLTLGLLGRLIRRESGSVWTARVAMVAFSASFLHVETIYWYSASSFMWALLAGLAAWLGAASAIETGTRRGLWAAGFGAAIAPAFSAIGLLAGPIAALRVIASGATRRARWLALAPLAGTGVYLLVYGLARRDAVPVNGAGGLAGPLAGLVAAARATAGVLVPGLFGLPALGRRMSDGVCVCVFAAAVVSTLLVAWRDRTRRPLLWGGLALVIGGYWLTFGARPGAGPLVQRYHLFPQVGLVFLLACLLRPWFVRLEARPLAGHSVALALCMLIVLVHWPEIHRRSKWYRYPDQRQTLVALDHVGSACRAHRITREQAIAALDPIWREWFPFEVDVFNLMEMLPVTVPSAVVPDSSVRPILLAALTPADRDQLCGSMDATRYVRPAAALVGAERTTVGRLVRSVRVRREAERSVSAGWPSFLEYEFPTAAAPNTDIIAAPASPRPLSGVEARALCVPGGTGGERIEIWWTADDRRWSNARRLRWRIEPTRAGEDCAVALDQIPQWHTSEARYVRVVFRSPGPIRVGVPRLLW